MKTFMKGKRKSLLILFLIFSFLIAIPVSAVKDLGSADLSLKGSIKITSEFPPDLLLVDVYKLGTAKEVRWTEPESFTYMERAYIYFEPEAAFADLNWDLINSGPPTKDGEYAFLDDAAWLIYNNGDILPPTYTQVSHVSVPADPGLYLVFAHHKDDDPKDYFTTAFDEDGIEHVVTQAYDKSTNTDFEFSPLLIHVPTKGKETEMDDLAWIYAVVRNFKAATGVHQYVTAYKEDSKTHERLPGAKFKLYSSTGYPSSDFITCYDEQGNIQYLYAQEANTDSGLYVSDENGRVILPTPDPTALYALVEVEAPNGYLLSPEPRFFYPSFYGQEIQGVKYTQVQIDTADRGKSALIYSETFSSTRKSVTLSLPEDEAPRFVRAKAVVPDNCSVEYGGEGWTYNPEDGYFYYDNVLYPGESTAPLLMSLVPPDFEWDNPNYSGKNIGVIYESSKVVFSNDDPPYPDGYDDEYLWDAANPIYNVEYLEEVSFVFENASDKPDEPVEMPGAGGIGTALYTVAGTVMLTGALLLLAAEKKRTRKTSV